MMTEQRRETIDYGIANQAHKVPRRRAPLTRLYAVFYKRYVQGYHGRGVDLARRWVTIEDRGKIELLFDAATLATMAIEKPRLTVSLWHNGCISIDLFDGLTRSGGYFLERRTTAEIELLTKVLELDGAG